MAAERARLLARHKRASNWIRTFSSPNVRPKSQAPSLRFDTGGLDNRPPSFDFSLVVSTESGGALSLPWRDVLAKPRKLLAHGRVREGFNSRGVQTVDNRLWCSLWRPQCTPGRHCQLRQSCLADSLRDW